MFKMASLPSLCAALALLGAAPAQSSDSCDGFALSSETLYGGPHCLAERPKRVVVLDPSFSLGIGMDVGLPIVGAPMTRMGDADLAARAAQAGVENLGFVTEPSLERLVALQPDAIVGFTGNVGLAESFYPLFAQIAPTLLETKVDWRSYYHQLAQISGQEDDVAARLAELDQRIAEIRAKIPADFRLSVLRITSWDMQSFAGGPDAYAPFALLHDLGIIRSDYEESGSPAEVLRPDWEDLAKLDGDTLFYIVGGTNDSDVDGRHEEVLDHPLWKMMPAVQAGRVFRVDHGTWMEFNGLASAHKVLDDVEAYVLGNN